MTRATDKKVDAWTEVDEQTMIIGKKIINNCCLDFFFFNFSPLLCLDGEKVHEGLNLSTIQIHKPAHISVIRKCNLKLYVRWLVNLIKQNNKLGETSSKCRSWDINKLMEGYYIFTVLRTVFGWNVLKPPSCDTRRISAQFYQRIS